MKGKGVMLSSLVDLVASYVKTSGETSPSWTIQLLKQIPKNLFTFCS